MAASVTAALPCRGIIGIDIGVEVDLFKGRCLDTPLIALRTLPLEVDGEGLDFGVVKDPDLGVEERSRRVSALGGESSDRSSVSDMASASFAAGPGDMVSRKGIGAARIESPGCATMISSELPEVGIVAIGIHRDIQVHVDVEIVLIVYPAGCRFQKMRVSAR
jgi:hypothetical protein